MDRITDDLDYSGDQFPLDCLVDLGGLPLDLVEEDQIVLRAADPGGCLDWAVELWIDEPDRGGEPARPAMTEGATGLTSSKACYDIILMS